jgi:hypothetical protein
MDGDAREFGLKVKALEQFSLLNDVWPSSDHWGRHTYKEISKRLVRYCSDVMRAPNNVRLLNVGSHGNDYGITAREHVQIDLAADDWVFYDSRFNLMHASDETLVRFLAETVHPIVRPDTDEARKIVGAFNHELAADGWMLAEVKKISERPVFAGQRIGSRAQIFDEPTGWQKVDRQMQEVRMRLDALQHKRTADFVTAALCAEGTTSVVNMLAVLAGRRGRTL